MRVETPPSTASHAEEELLSKQEQMLEQRQAWCWFARWQQQPSQQGSYHRRCSLKAVFIAVSTGGVAMPGEAR